MRTREAKPVFRLLDSFLTEGQLYLWEAQSYTCTWTLISIIWICSRVIGGLIWKGNLKKKKNYSQGFVRSDDNRFKYLNLNREAS